MSLLADLLAKNKSGEPHGDREIPPTLSRSYAEPAAPRSMKSRYAVIASVSVSLVIAGIVAMTQFGRLTALLSPKPAVITPPRVAELPKPPAPKAAESQQSVAQLSINTTQNAGNSSISRENTNATNAISDSAAEKKRSKSYNHKNGTRQRRYPPPRMSRTAIQPVVPQTARTTPKKMDISVVPRPGTRSPVSVDTVKRDALLYEARSAEMVADWRTALHKYRSALAIDPDNFKIMNNIAASLNNLGKFDEGAREARRALAKSPQYVPAMINAAIAYSSSGNSMEGVLLFTDASAADPENKNLTINLGVMQERAGKLDEAQATYRQLADAGDPHALMGIARIYERKGYKNEAARMYRRIQKMPEAGSVLKKEIKDRLTKLEE